MRHILVFLHRWVAVALAALFLLWFLSGIVLTYWDFPSVRAEDRLERAQALDPSALHFAPAEACRINIFDGRPVFRYRDGRVIFADTNEARTHVDPSKIAAAWTGQAIQKVESI